MEGSSPTRRRRVRGTPRTPRTPTASTAPETTPSSIGRRSLRGAGDVPPTSPPERRTPVRAARSAASGRRGTPRTPASGMLPPQYPPASSSRGDLGEPSSALGTPATPGTGSVQATPVPGGIQRAGGVPGTPMSLPRSDLRGGAGPNRPMVAGTDGLAATSSEIYTGTGTDAGGQRRVIFGTNVDVDDSMNRFKKFFREFDDGKYVRLIEEIHQTEVMNINLDCSDLVQFEDAALYNQLITYPQEVIPLCDVALNQLFDPNQTRGPDVARVQVRVFNIPDKRGVRDLGPSDLNHLVCIRGMITRLSSIIPDMREAFFRCVVCKTTLTELNDRGRINEPDRCQHCGTQRSFELIHNRSIFANKQLARMQEAPESIPEGETPHTVSLYVFEDLCDVPRPGDRVEVTGIYRATPIRMSQARRNVSTTFKTWFDVIHIRKFDSDRMSAEAARQDQESEFYTQFDESAETMAMNEEKEAKLKALGRDPDIVNKLIKALAPSIWEMDDVKKGLLCQLFGGVNRKFANSEQRLRGEINVLLVGDPATAKSQLLQYVHKLAPRGVYTSGRGSSGVGLTAYVTRDPETSDFVLESGALVVSDRGICCIDEFDKMTQDSRSMLHEAMEQQTISIAKAGIIATLNARTSILAAANPVASKYDARKSIVDNINLPPTLLSRFDLIFLVLDKPNREMDTRLARHVISLQYKDPVVSDSNLGVAQLAEYVSYARRTCNPILTDEVVLKVAETYRDMRMASGHDEQHKCVSATPRQLESLIRISEAFARMRLADAVTVDDVNDAHKLVRDALLRAATNPKTGQLDMDMITTGTSASQRRLAELVISDGVLDEDFMTVAALKTKLLGKARQHVDDAELAKAIKGLERQRLVRVQRDRTGEVAKIAAQT